ncbi:Adenosylcobinamide kinase [Candidatus Hodgkinia cicadicola]|uniref:Adenosylcobinamide kinase n=1 Tax=Candidatus Hodgkinia cicadicola TaxID=573658 RepID=A0ABX4MJI6_9HYPH|nr:Adenosylcobinamide kinase [Candidatus Hodgkinia cicadicola]
MRCSLRYNNSNKLLYYRVLIIGFTKTGKSRIVRSICNKFKTSYITTNAIYIKKIISHHIKNKPDNWNSYEETIKLITLIKVIDMTNIVIIDNIALWLANIMVLKMNCYNEVDKLLMALKKRRNWIIITHELNEYISIDLLNTRFIRLLKSTNQQLSTIAKQVYVNLTGYTLKLK